MAKVAKQALDAAGITRDDLAAFIPHQANMRIIDEFAKQLKLPESRRDRPRHRDDRQHLGRLDPARHPPPARRAPGAQRRPRPADRLRRRTGLRRPGRRAALGLDHGQTITVHEHPARRNTMALSTEEVLAGLAELINDETGIATDSVELDKSFTDDLDIDSISMMTIVVNAEEKFDVKIPDEEVKNLKTVGDAVSFIVNAQALSTRPGGGPLPVGPPARGMHVDSTRSCRYDQEDRRHRHRRLVARSAAPPPTAGPRLLAGESGAQHPRRTTGSQQYDLPVTFAAEAKVRPEEVLERQETKRLDPSAQFALISAREAWADAGSPEIDPVRLGVDYATGIGGLWTLLDAWDTLREKGPRRVLPDDGADAHAERGRRRDQHGPRRPRLRPHRRLGLRVEHRVDRQRLRAPAARARRRRSSPAAPSAAIHPITLASFASMQALSKRNDDPATASRPYDVDRDGFVMGEGAATLVLETEEHALARGARIYAEIAGGGVTSDSYHITAPDPEGRGAARAVLAALEQAGATVDDVTHINAHATSTPVGDIAEYKALLARVRRPGARHPACRPRRRRTGHLLGGTGALEAIFTILAVQERIAPPTINLTEQDPEIPLDVVDVAAARSATGRSWRSATRSGSAATTPSSRSARV